MAQSFGITSPAVEQYLYQALPPRPAVLQAMEAHAERENVPIIGPVEGQFLYALALGAGTRAVLEIGTATGYSGLWLGLAARARQGRVLSLERDAARADLAEGFWRQAALADTCVVRRGDAFDSLAALTERFDFIFIDILTQLAGPVDADRLFDLCVDRLVPGGLLVADNALRRGQIADPANQEPSVTAMRRYLERCATHPELTTTIVPLRDGIAISVRQPGGL
jgi:predicted O-methyltransferase YrrM